MKRDILSKKAEAISGMRLPQWLVRPCPHCDKDMPLISIIGIGIELTPKMFGNVSVNYVCPHCDSLIENHYVGERRHSMDIMEFLSKEEEPSEPVMLEDLISSPGGNLDV